MKCYLTEVRILLAALLIAGTSCTATEATQTPSEVDAANSMQLSVAALAALESEQFAEAGFLYFAARTRSAIDAKVYPPKGKGGDSPLTALGAVMAISGGPVLKPVLNRPEALAAATKRFEAWKPPVSGVYDPGWKYEEPLNAEDAERIRDEVHAQMLGVMRQKLRLYENQEYRELSQEIDRANEVMLRDTMASKYRGPLGGGTVPKQGGPIIEAAPSEEQVTRARKVIEHAKEQQAKIAWQIDPTTRFHHRQGWKAEEYFDDDKVVQLCRAIEQDDLVEMRRLIELGVEINAVGKKGVTPLLWAFPDFRLERFRLLLEHGADPNVSLTDDTDLEVQELFLGLHSSIYFYRVNKGVSITHLACASPELDHLRLVLANRGDPNLKIDGEQETPLAIVIPHYSSDLQKRVRLLLDAGADPNLAGVYVFQTDDGKPYKPPRTAPLELAVEQNQYELAKMLLDAGAKPVMGEKSGLPNIAIDLVSTEYSVTHYDKQKRASYAQLVERLERDGVNFAAARAYLDKTGRVWGEAKHEKSRREQEEWKRKSDELAAARTKALLEARNARLGSGNAVEESVRLLTPEQLEDLRMPDSINAPVFHYSIESANPKQPNTLAVSINVYADGRLECQEIDLVREAATYQGRIELVELTWLLHLAVHEANLLNVSASYEELVAEARSRWDAMQKKIKVRIPPESERAVAYGIQLREGTTNVRIPLSLERFLEAGPIAELGNVRPLNKYLFELQKQVKLGDEAQDVLTAVNDLLAEEYPQIPPFTVDHLNSCQKNEDGDLSCSFIQTFEYAGRTEETVARYARKDGEIKVTTNSRMYRRALNSPELPAR
ncbi:ankyrin repeat domain-containing protein [Aeoliella sp. SH292]|uniref:ankyrin repeat domain-containing protein n=1 Tax=Aeoliella sp. SH292 TaxID=3454464 RepID=UPI003F946ADC